MNKGTDTKQEITEWVVALIGIFILGFGAAVVYTGMQRQQEYRIAWTPTSTVRYYTTASTTSYAFKGEARLRGVYTSPLLECGESNELGIGERAQIEKQVQAYVTAAEQKKTVRRVSVYFRDLSNGPWFGVNERDEFVPASLLKLPIAMSYYRAEPAMLDAVPYDTGLMPIQDAINTTYGSSKPLKPEGMKARELIAVMLTDSSNEAASLLADYMGTQKLLEVYKDFGIEAPQDSGYTIDVKTYAAFFRVLYNASYVPQGASEKILDSLAQSTFKNGIVAGVPEQIAVSHKFGIREFEDGTMQLHDCGIVYATETTYVLCVMTQGEKLANLEATIREISRITYKGIAEAKGVQ